MIPTVFSTRVDLQEDMQRFLPASLQLRAGWASAAGSSERGGGGEDLHLKSVCNPRSTYESFVQLICQLLAAHGLHDVQIWDT